MGDLLYWFQVKNRCQQAADVSGNCCCLHRDPFPAFHQPSIEGERKRSLGGFDPGMKGGKIFDQHKGVGFTGVIQLLAAGLPRGGANDEPIGTDGDLGSKAGMAGGLHPEGSGRGL